MNAEQIAYGQQKNREFMYAQAIQERKETKTNLKDESKWGSSDEVWTDYRYMQLCSQSKITPW